MSRVTKMKHVLREVLDGYVLPEARQKIVKVIRIGGNNLHEVETPEGDKFLVSMPTKFRKILWIKRGDFLIVDPIEEGVKVKAEICHILYKHNIKFIKEEGKWPAAFDDNTKLVEHHAKIPSAHTDEDEDSDSTLFVNTNRMDPYSCESEEEEEEDDEDNYEEEEESPSRDEEFSGEEYDSEENVDESI